MAQRQPPRFAGPPPPELPEPVYDIGEVGVAPPKTPSAPASAVLELPGERKDDTVGGRKRRKTRKTRKTRQRRSRRRTTHRV